MTWPWDDSDNFARRMAGTGWPEWEEGSHKYSYQRPQSPSMPGIYIFGGTSRAWWHHAFVTDHEASCLIEIHWTEWLRERRVYVHPSSHYHDFVLKRSAPTWGWLAEGGFWANPADVLVPIRFATFDAAQGAAIDAVLAEKEKDDG